MELTPRLRLMNWLVSQGLESLPENDLIRGFCERCRAEGLEVSRAMVFIDTLHPIFEGRGFRWNDTATNESDTFEYGSSDQGENAQNWRRSVFYHMLENGHQELALDLAGGAASNFGMIGDLRSEGLTIMLVEQKARQTLKFADRAYVLETGRVVMSGAAGELAGNAAVSEAFLEIGRAHV